MSRPPSRPPTPNAVRAGGRVSQSCRSPDGPFLASKGGSILASAEARERRRGATGEAVVHPETHTALAIRPTTFAEFARRNAAELRGELVPS
jgi:hypothetical protein